MSDFNLVMVSAFHEQGGNVLHRHLDGHPELFVYPFESTMATKLSSNAVCGPNHIIPQRYSYPEFSSEISAEDAYHFMSDHELKPYMRSKNLSKFKDCGMEINEKERIEIFKKLVSDARYNNADNVGDGGFCSRGQYIEAFFKSTFDAWKNYPKTGKERFYVGYIPPIIFDADKFFSDFPNGKMIHIVRNPFSGYADTIKRPYPFSLEQYCQIWNFTQLQALNYVIKYPGRVLMIKYEDLVSRKEDIMKMVSDFIGIEWSEKLLYPSFAGKKLDEVYPWGTIKKPTLEENLLNIESLSPDLIEKILRETSLMLKILNYLINNPHASE